MIFDIILIIILAGFVLKGFRLGLIEGIGSLVGIVVGLIVAANYYVDLAASFEWIFLGNQTVAQIVCFLLIFIIVNRLIATIFWIFDKMFKIIAFIPFLKTFNRLLGAVLGLIEGVFVIGIVLHLLVNFTQGDYWDSKIEGSKAAGIFQSVTSVVTPLIPERSEQLKEYIPNIDLDKYKVPDYKMPDIEELLK
jgi:membrane protein required for colicin V production